MVSLGRSVLQTGPYVLCHEIGIIGKDFFLRHTRRQQIEHVGDADAHSADAGPSSALIRVESDSIQVTHASSVARPSRLTSLLQRCQPRGCRLLIPGAELPFCRCFCSSASSRLKTHAEANISMAIWRASLKWRPILFQRTARVWRSKRYSHHVFLRRKRVRADQRGKHRRDFHKVSAVRLSLLARQFGLGHGCSTSYRPFRPAGCVLPSTASAVESNSRSSFPFMSPRKRRMRANDCRRKSSAAR